MINDKKIYFFSLQIILKIMDRKQKRRKSEITPETLFARTLEYILQIPVQGWPPKRCALHNPMQIFPSSLFDAVYNLMQTLIRPWSSWTLDGVCLRRSETFAYNGTVGSRAVVDLSKYTSGNVQPGRDKCPVETQGGYGALDFDDELERTQKVLSRYLSTHYKWHSPFVGSLVVDWGKRKENCVWCCGQDGDELLLFSWPFRISFVFAPLSVLHDTNGTLDGIVRGHLTV